VSQAGNITVDLAYRSLPSYSGQLSWVEPFAPFAEEAVYPRRVEAYKPISFFNEGQGLSAAAQQYDATSIINDLRAQVDTWRALPNANDWLVSPETARLLQHWRHYQFNGVRPFFCQVEAVETIIYLTEVAPKRGKGGKASLEHLANANAAPNPELMRIALKLATGAGKTTVMAML